jgi:hypothetical protein
MAAGLAELAASRDLQIVVASHSPALLDHPEATVTRVASTPHRWKGPTSEAVTMTAPRRSELEELGLQPSDLLASRRVILLVEGHHDELVIRGILGQELERLRVDVLPVNKGSNLRAAIDSRLLFDYTDATVIAIVDNLNGDRVLGVWDRALVIATTDGPERAGEFIRRELPASQAPENGFIAQFMSRAITAGLESRVVPFAFSAPDIQEYLPTRGFLPGRASWADLRAEWTSSGTALAFKPWLQQHKGAQFDDAAFSKALDMLEAVPPEFTHLLKVIEARTANRAAVDPLPYST